VCSGVEVAGIEVTLGGVETSDEVLDGGVGLVGSFSAFEFVEDRFSGGWDSKVTGRDIVTHVLSNIENAAGDEGGEDESQKFHDDVQKII
jgi:hypothetical protein